MELITTTAELADFGAVSQRLATAIQSATGATGTYFLSFGENYPHFHFLVIARDTDLAPESRGAAILGLREHGRDLDASLAVGSRVRDALAGVTL